MNLFKNFGIDIGNKISKTTKNNKKPNGIPNFKYEMFTVEKAQKGAKITTCYKPLSLVSSSKIQNLFKFCFQSSILINLL